MFNITGHLCLMSFDFTFLNSLHITSYSVCSATLFLCHIGHFSWVRFGSFTCVIVLTAFLVEICVILGQELSIACIVQ